MLLQIERLSKTYHNVTVLKNIDLTIEPGEFVSLLGPSGAGKTTLLRIIAGLESSDAGTITLNRQDLLALPAHRRAVGLVFQNYALFPHLTVKGNIYYGLKLRKPSYNRQQRQQRFSELTQICQIPAQLWERHPAELSGGQQQRIALARTLAIQPDLLLLDEPFAALDAKLRQQTREELLAMLKSCGIGCLMISHHQQEALAMSDRVAIMLAGEIAQYQSPKQLLSNLADHRIADFLNIDSSDTFSI